MDSVNSFWFRTGSRARVLWEISGLAQKLLALTRRILGSDALNYKWFNFSFKPFQEEFLYVL